MEKTLTSLVAGASATLSAVFFNPYEVNAQGAKKFYDETHIVPMYYQGKEVDKKRVEIELFAGNDPYRTVLTITSENFNKKHWSGTERRIPFYLRHTPLISCDTFVAHPKDVRVLGSEQRAYIIPQHKMEVLSPYQEAEKSRIVMELGEEILKKGFGKIGETFGIPFVEQAFEEFIDYQRKKRPETLKEEIENKSNLNEDYVITQIPQHVSNSFRGHTETARKYNIVFNIGNTKRWEIPMNLFVSCQIGHLGNNAGKLEWKSINFDPMEYERENIKFAIRNKRKNMGYINKREMEFISDNCNRTTPEETALCFYSSYFLGREDILREILSSNTSTEISEIIISESRKDKDREEKVRFKLKPTKYLYKDYTGKSIHFKYKNGGGSYPIWLEKEDGKKWSVLFEESIYDEKTFNDATLLVRKDIAEKEKIKSKPYSSEWVEFLERDK